MGKKLYNPTEQLSNIYNTLTMKNWDPIVKDSLTLLLLKEQVISPGPKEALEKIKRTETIEIGAAVNVVETILSTLNTACKQI